MRNIISSSFPNLLDWLESHLWNAKKKRNGDDKRATNGFHLHISFHHHFHSHMCNLFLSSFHASWTELKWWCGEEWRWRNIKNNKNMIITIFICLIKMKLWRMRISLLMRELFSTIKNIKSLSLLLLWMNENENRENKSGGGLFCVTKKSSKVSTKIISSFFLYCKKGKTASNLMA